MPYVVTLLVLFGVLSVFNLVITAGLVRRLRENGSAGSARSQTGPIVMRAPGERVAPFRAVTLDGAAISEAVLNEGPTLVATFGQGCPECAERLPGFVAYAETFPGGRDRVLAVMVGNRDDVAEELARLEPVARVVLEGREGTVATALGVTGYPAFAILDEHATVRASGLRLESVTRALSARA
ncbi:TlpA family protein disulfide reductase [Embleya hyalina]|uniref:TlpA family protein n=1 Tax=Embleya hyalina TaxID=516124 RepID=A0A401YN50_9ACTN|nr:TlpA disulfide reductase family protein [Embleya hyalina]GCD96040.1 TlpA family protein [Embleya hyalina]